MCAPRRESGFTGLMAVSACFFLAQGYKRNWSSPLHPLHQRRRPASFRGLRRRAKGKPVTSRHSMLRDILADALGCGGANSPYGTDPSALPPPDMSSYPHTHLPEVLVAAMLREMSKAQGSEHAILVVEVGSFVGGSAARLARALASAPEGSVVLCIDPFCGDANMWSDVNGMRSWLGLRSGRPTVFEQVPRSTSCDDSHLL